MPADRIFDNELWRDTLASIEFVLANGNRYNLLIGTEGTLGFTCRSSAKKTDMPTPTSAWTAPTNRSPIS